MPTPVFRDLTQLSVLTEIIVRGGDLHDSSVNVRLILQNNYRVYSLRYGVYGISVLVNADPIQPATYDQLAQRNPIFNRKLSISIIGAVVDALRSVRYGMVCDACDRSSRSSHLSGC